MCVVYLAMDEELGRQVALKVIVSHGSITPSPSPSGSSSVIPVTDST